ncbi:uncharacterized protein VTP21DRAFT_5313 [Calcarisporiella thermophila]|uniref:uncharacterized protein n=1 Tax=Calcarisporiella thermophila TaxID=911321 RepID=UPI003741EA7E
MVIHRILLILAFSISVLSSDIEIISPTAKDILHFGRLTNIHVRYNSHPRSSLIFEHAPCGSTIRSLHDTIGTVNIDDLKAEASKKFVWHIPKSSTITTSHCIQLWDASGKLISESEPLKLVHDFDKRRIGIQKNRHYNVADHYMKRHFASKDLKEIKIGIVGAGMAGLFSAMLLDSVGVNYEILEGSGRLGGRVHTEYFGEDENEYAELGAMRLPYKWQFGDKEVPVQGHEIVLRLIDYVNEMVKKKEKLKLIDYINSDKNNLYYFNGVKGKNGRVFTQGEAASDPVKAGFPKELLREGNYNQLLGKTIAPLIQEFAIDYYSAREKLNAKGYNDYSLGLWMRTKLNLTWNVIDFLEIAAMPQGAVLQDIENIASEFYAFSASKFVTIKGGMGKLPNTMGRIIKGKIRNKAKVIKIETGKNDVTLSYLHHEGRSQKKYNYAIVTAPFSVVRNWELPRFSWVLRRAIDSMPYVEACKVYLKFTKPFWEEGDRPIKGGCSTTDLPVKQVCYPRQSSKNGILLGAYLFDRAANGFASIPEKELKEMVLNNLEKLHGQPVRKTFTGDWKHKCYLNDEFAAGAFSFMAVGQHERFIPEIFRLEQNVAFAGEHTDFKGGWVASALQSAARAVVSILVDMGHVDKAKKIVKDWDLFWLHI